MGLPVAGRTPDVVRTAIKIQSTFQCLRESCLLEHLQYNIDFLILLIPTPLVLAY